MARFLQRLETESEPVQATETTETPGETLEDDPVVSTTTTTSVAPP